jgi:rhodanese-related sulfurtransferase
MFKNLAIIIFTITATSVSAEYTVNATTMAPSNPPAKMDAQTMVSGISPQAAAGAVGEQRAIIIDVREPSEAALTKIPGAINIPLSQLKNRLVELDKYKQSPIITQCRTGNRSKEALKILSSSGFTHLKNLDGGIVAWEKAGLKTEKKCC